jgi:hypothetical protein
MKPRRCHLCRADVENNHLRMTRCLDGELRLLCEHCSLDEEQVKAEVAARLAARESRTA